MQNIIAPFAAEFDACDLASEEFGNDARAALSHLKSAKQEILCSIDLPRRAEKIVVSYFADDSDIACYASVRSSIAKVDRKKIAVPIDVFTFADEANAFAFAYAVAKAIEVSNETPNLK